MPTKLGPFGANSCEREKTRYGMKFGDYFYRVPHFMRELMSTPTFLIVGRRGTGKTTLTEYLKLETNQSGSSVVTIDAESVRPLLLVHPGHGAHHIRTQHQRSDRAARAGMGVPDLGSHLFVDAGLHGQRAWMARTSGQGRLFGALVDATGLGDNRPPVLIQ